MKRFLLCAVAAASVMISAGVASAQALLYSFETGTPASPDDFTGIAGTTVSQSNIGVTHLANSMKNVTAAGATFAAARTLTIPAPLDPNNQAIHSVDFDLTINAGEEFSGAFSNIGITLFGHGDPDGIPGNGDEQFGLQFQVRAASERNVDLAPGTYHLTIPLIGTNPMTFVPDQTFEQVFGPGPNQIFQISAFQFFYSKSGDGLLTTYIDNVRVLVPEPGSAFVACAMFGGLLIRRRSRKH
jgi:hypothetical protein